MNYDPVFYHTLTPLILAYKGIAFQIMAAALGFHWMRASISGMQGDGKGTSAGWKTCILTFLIYTLFYVPVPNPGSLIGFEDRRVDAQAIGESSTFIFVVERISYGADALGRHILGFDMTVKAQTHLEETTVTGDAGTVTTATPPNNSEIMYNFILMRAQYLQLVIQNMWNHEDLVEKGVLEEKAEEEFGGAWDFLRSLTAGQMSEYLTTQIGALLYNLTSAVGSLLAMVALFLIGLILYLLAGLVKFAAVYMAALVLFLLPFAWFINGHQALKVVFNLMIVYIPVKVCIILVIWLGFFMIEGIQLQGYQEAAVNSLVLTNLIDQYQPGFLYTVSGSTMLSTVDNLAGVSQNGFVLAKTLVSMIVCLLATLYIVLKTPSIVSSMLGIQSIGDDLFTTTMFVTGAVVSAGTTVAAKAAMGTVKDGGNMIVPEKGDP